VPKVVSTLEPVIEPLCSAATESSRVPALGAVRSHLVNQIVDSDADGVRAKVNPQGNHIGAPRVASVLFLSWRYKGLTAWFLGKGHGMKGSQPRQPQGAKLTSPRKRLDYG